MESEANEAQVKDALSDVIPKELIAWGCGQLGIGITLKLSNITSLL
jgi:hypothetical protein